MIPADPIYPRPAEARVRLAMQHFCDVAEYIAPSMDSLASYLIRAMIFRGPTVAEAMWALHELIQENAISTTIGPSGRTTTAPTSESWPAAGLEWTKGTLHIDSGTNHDWSLLYIAIHHQRVAELKASLRGAATSSAAAKSLSLGRPRKDQPRITINARMLHEMSRNPDTENWSLRAWATYLDCSASAIAKTAAWKAVVKNREAQKISLKSKSIKRYEE